MSNKLKLYSLATPNGQKVSIALEEMGLPYEAIKIDIMKGEQFKPEYIAINPNSKIPSLVDPEGDNGKPLHIMESGAILMYLAEKTGQFLPTTVAGRSKALQWLFFQVGGPGPMFGQFGHFFKYAKDKCDHPYPVERYTTETKRLLKVIDTQLEKETYIAGPELTIADMALAPWVKGLSRFYKGDEVLGLKDLKNIERWEELLWSRKGFIKGAEVCAI